MCERKEFLEFFLTRLSIQKTNKKKGGRKHTNGRRISLRRKSPPVALLVTSGKYRSVRPSRLGREVPQKSLDPTQVGTEKLFDPRDLHKNSGVAVESVHRTHVLSDGGMDCRTSTP